MYFVYALYDDAELAYGEGCTPEGAIGCCMEEIPSIYRADTHDIVFHVNGKQAMRLTWDEACDSQID